LRSTKSRVPALQICPELANTAMPGAWHRAFEIGIAKTMSGDLPPSSKRNTLQVPAESLHDQIVRSDASR